MEFHTFGIVVVTQLERLWRERDREREGEREGGEREREREREREGERERERLRERGTERGTQRERGWEREREGERGREREGERERECACSSVCRLTTLPRSSCMTPIIPIFTHRAPSHIYCPLLGIAVL